jgi:hypothetical protein
LCQAKRTSGGEGWQMRSIHLIRRVLYGIQ